MTDLRQAAQMALEALQVAVTPLQKDRQEVLLAQAALRAALAQQAEPVAWMDREGDLYEMPEIENWAPPHTMLYTAPPQRQWVGLTDAEIEYCVSLKHPLAISEEVEAKLKEKNT